MKIKKKIDVEININGKYCDENCKFYKRCEYECDLFRNEKGFPEYLNNVDVIDGEELIKRCPECIKEFGYKNET